MEAEKETKQFKWLSGNGGNGPVFPIDYSQRSFAKYLNEINVTSPAEHKHYLGLKFKTSFQMNATAKWTAAAVLRILKNPLYIGTLIQGKYTTPNYKVKKRICVPESKWICIENNHSIENTINKLVEVWNENTGA